MEDAGAGPCRPARNTDLEIADALDLAIAARTERAALAVLTGLAGVDVPVASAILTAVDPARFTIIDFRALWSLCVERVIYYPVGFISSTLRHAAGSRPMPASTCGRWTARFGGTQRKISRGRLIAKSPPRVVAV